MIAESSDTYVMRSRIEDLKMYLANCEDHYLAISDEDARRRYATVCLGGLVQKLGNLGLLPGVDGLRFVSDMFDFLDDIHRGRDHPWRSLGVFGGLQAYTRNEERYRSNILISIEILVDAYNFERGAQKRAIDLVFGLQKGSAKPLTASRIKGLYHEYKRGEYPHPEVINVVMEDFWRGKSQRGAIARCPHGDPVHRCSQSNLGRCKDIAEVAERSIPQLFIDA